MKIAISTDTGSVSAHFGRCPSYTIINIEDGKITKREEIPNPGHEPGFLPQFLAEKGVSTIIAGGMGPRAQSLFAQKNIATITGIQGSVDEVIDKCLKNELKPGEDLCGHKQEEVHEYSDSTYKEQISTRKGTKICITAKGKDLEAEVDPRFGRAQYFLLIDPIAMQIEAVENPYKDTAQGAGIQTAQLLADKGVSVLLTGHVGPKAAGVLKSAGIQAVNGVSGKVKEVIQNFAKEIK